MPTQHKLPPTAGRFGELRGRRQALAGALIIAGLALFAYWPSLGGGFIWEDGLLLTQNELIAAPDGLFRVWVSTEQPDYIPLTSSTLWIEWRLWGMNPTGYRVTNLALHVAACWLLWALLRKLSVPGAFLAALLYAVHPVNVESVAWIEQRKDTLSTVFFLLSILWYLPSIKQRTTDDGPRTNPWYWLSLLAFALAMFSKGSVATLPVVLLLVVWWRRGRITKGDLLRSAPFFVLSVVLTPMIVWFVTHGAEEVVRDVSVLQRLQQAGAVVWFYLSKALAPIKLIFLYPMWDIQANNLLWWLPLAAALMVTLLLLWRFRSPQAAWIAPLLFAWVFFCVALAPAMGFFDPGFMKISLVADHYQHLALMAVVSLVAAGVSIAYASISRPARRLIVAAAGIVVIACTGLTWRQSRLYDNDIHLYEVTLIDNPNCWTAHFNLANALSAAGQKQQAIDHFREAARLKPDFAAAYVSLGKVFSDIGRPNEAVAQFRQALQVRPDYALAYYNLGAALANLGQLEAAIQQFREALRVQNEFPAAHLALANALRDSGQLPQAIEHFNQALRLDPHNADTHYNLGMALLNSGRLQDAASQFEEAVRLQPDRLQAYAKLTAAYAQLQQPAKAIATAEKALAVARASGQMEMVEQIEPWLKTYRAQQANAPDAASGFQSLPPAK